MNRVIKFRAWDKYNAIMLPVMDWDFCVGIIGTGSYTNKKGHEVCGNIIQNYEIMQYTGMKDKNGKEIFENDIIKDCDNSAPWLDELYKVNYSAGCFEIIPVRENIAVKLLWEMGDIEVVGNIFENPELLK